ncbi:MAG: transposase family protein [Acidobacteria bacterium]|nr:transposase family protein [Acidobacteriota bacterium]
MEYVPRLSRDLSLSGRRVYLRFEQRRFRCLHCQRSFLEGLPSIASPGAHYTKRYEEWMVRQVNHSNVQKVAHQEGLSWDSVQRILQRVAEREGLLAAPAVVRWVAFDEIALKKRHQQYALIVSAPEEGRILAVLESRVVCPLTGKCINHRIPANLLLTRYGQSDLLPLQGYVAPTCDR